MAGSSRARIPGRVGFSGLLGKINRDREPQELEMTPLNPCSGCAVSALAGEKDPIRGRPSTDCFFGNWNKLNARLPWHWGCMNTPEQDGFGSPTRRLAIWLAKGMIRGGGRSADDQENINWGHVIDCLADAFLLPNCPASVFRIWVLRITFNLNNVTS